MAIAPTTTATADSRTPDEGSWVHGCFVAKLGTDYNTYKEIMAYALQDELYGSKTKPTLDPAVKTILDGGGDQNGPLPIYFSKRKCRDSSLGGNDAINPLPQFSLDDDISHPHYYNNVTDGVGMGQVYSENYDDLQQVLYLGFGIPVFSNVGSFWAAATDMDLASHINKGSGITLEKIGYMIGSAPVRIVQIATIPFKFIAAMTDALQQVPMTKYYSFSSQMPMYFRFVNTILVMLATNMNIVGSSEEIPSTGSNTSNATSVGLLTEGTSKTEDMSGISSVFRDGGLDMARIMLKKFYYENGNQKTNTYNKRWTDQTLFESSNKENGDGVTADNTSNTTQSTSPDPNAANSTTPSDDKYSGLRKWKMSWFDNFKAAWGEAIYDGHLFIGFRIDKGMGGSESFSNSTGESAISQTANAKFQAGRDASFGTMDNNFGDGALSSAIEGVISMFKGVVAGAAEMISMDPLAAASAGAARIDIPEVWMSSSYSRSASFTITCLSPYGDFESIFQSEYVPLACILAGSLPRGTGISSHSSPFICQAYCKGIFASPLCMVESLEITRGADQFGLSMARLPLKLTMHVTLKDLSPIMYMSMGGDRGIMNAIMGTDDNFGEYMMTLSGMGLRDRLGTFRNIRRKTKILINTLYKNRLSPYMLGMEGGSQFWISRLISTFVSGGRNLPGN